MPALTKLALHNRIAEASSAWASVAGSLGQVPLLIDAPGFGAFALYAFTLTAPPGGRPIGEYKVQLIQPGQPRSARANLDLSDDRFAVIVGWSPEAQVFALWDAYAHASFAYSQNLQVRGDAVWIARTDGISSCPRTLRQERGTETVVVCRGDHLKEGLGARMDDTVRRIADLG